MPFNDDIKSIIYCYATDHLPDDTWYNENFYPFIANTELRNRLIIEFKNARTIYKIFEGLQAKDELLLAQVKTQVIMYVSIQEAVINYVLFELYKGNTIVHNLLNQKRPVKISIPQHKKTKLIKELSHNGEDIVCHYMKTKKIDRTKIRYDQKVNACHKLKLIDNTMKNDLIKLYEYRNTIHIEAEMKKNFNYDLDMSKLAYRKVEGLSIQLQENFME